MAALWLAIVAPVVSRTLVADATGAPMGAGCAMLHGGGSVPSPGLPHGHPLEQCGYCGLLACHSLLPATAPLPPTPPRFATLPLRAPASRAPAADRPLTAAPRGPPRFTAA